MNLHQSRVLSPTMPWKWIFLTSFPSVSIRSKNQAETKDGVRETPGRGPKDKFQQATQPGAQGVHRGSGGRPGFPVDSMLLGYHFFWEGTFYHSRMMRIVFIGKYVRVICVMKANPPVSAGGLRESLCIKRDGWCLNLFGQYSRKFLVMTHKKAYILYDDSVDTYVNI